MSKIVLSIVSFALIIGFWGVVGNVSAAESLEAAEVMGQENLTILLKTLDILEILLKNLELQLSFNRSPSLDLEMTNNLLSDIEGSLLEISYTASFLEKDVLVSRDRGVEQVFKEDNNIYSIDVKEVAEASASSNYGRSFWLWLLAFILVAASLVLRKRKFLVESKSKT